MSFVLSFVVLTEGSVQAVNRYNNTCFLLEVSPNHLILNDSLRTKKVVNDTIKNKRLIKSSQERYKKQILEKYISLDSNKLKERDYIGKPSIYNSSLSYDYSNRRFYRESIMSDSYPSQKSKIYSLKEYIESQQLETLTDYWREKSAEDAGIHKHSGIIPELSFGGKLFDAIFGSNKIVIKPQGSAELTLGIKTSEVDNPTIPESLRSTTMMDFREHIQVNVEGSIGDRLKLGISYNTQATFDFENKINLDYDGKEDDIIKKIEAGNVSLPLSGTLITGGQNLFGFKTKMQFGNLGITTLISQQKGETSVVNLEKGAQKKEFNISAVDYEVNRHFFLAKYFMENYDKALANLPIINSSIIITKVEVWVTNKNSRFEESRNIVAFTDLASHSDYIYNKVNVSSSIIEKYPYNSINNLYSDMKSLDAVRNINTVSSVLGGMNYKPIEDYQKIENAKMLQSNEYTFHPQLGYISLNKSLNADEVLAVAYEYTTRDGTQRRVGEFTATAPSAPSTIYLKLLKGTNLNPKLPHWDLMMKNIYNIGAYGASKDDFSLNIMYRDDRLGTNLNYISISDNSSEEKNVNGKVLLKVLNLDALNKQLDAKPDGQFDYINGLTIVAEKGRVIFPVLQPFGGYLEKKFDIGSSRAKDYVFKEIYTETQTTARQLSQKNKFNLEGTYKSTSNSDISLGSSNIKPGGVKVIAGSRELTENIDYTVDYAMGKVKIINQGILEAGTPIKVSSESNSLFSMQTKTLIGTHLDYRVADNFNLGATVLHLSESPLTRKVNIGEEPISNTIWGVNGSYSTEWSFLTKMVDAIPFIDTKAKSKISIDAEFAHFIPGHNGSIGDAGNAYVDDFEGSKILVSLKTPFAWKLSSTPQDGDISSYTNINDGLKTGFNRAKMAWYSVDPLFYRTEEPNMPSHIKGDVSIRSNHFTREIKQTELFPNKDIAVGNANIISAMNISFYPKDRGPYNFDAESILSDGSLKDPKKNWGGIMRKLQTSDFESANIQYIEFWLLDPFLDEKLKGGGHLYFDLGEISEDILRDSRKSFENGLPSSSEIINVDETVWGRVPNVQSLVNGFDNNASSRKYQDVGLDGLSSEEEKVFFDDFLEKIRNKYGIVSPVFLAALDDPSADDYHYFRGSDYDSDKKDILSRYKYYNNLEGNSPTTEMSNESYSTTASLQPDVEDINQDNTLNESESFYRYSVNLDELRLLHDQKVDDMNLSKNSYISDIRQVAVALPNGEIPIVKWYQYKIPLKEYKKKYGSIDGFKSIRFMRMLLNGFEQEVNLRFASLGLVRDNWRMHDKSFEETNEISEESEIRGKLDVSAVSIEENASKTPVNYVLPPGIDRAFDSSSAQFTQMNEQALLLKVTDLEDGYSRQVYKNVTLDMLKYKRLKMDVHAESIDGNLDDDDLRLFIRIGSDYLNNYYEYELPLKLTNPGVYGDSDEDRRMVWPDLNRVDIPLEYFQRVKLARNDKSRAGDQSAAYNRRYQKTLGQLENNSKMSGAENLITVKGNPTVAEVKTLMIGIRNPKGDDGSEKSAEVWVNELRMSDFDESGGWAANIRLNARLADFANITLAGRKITPGFGNIDQKISQVSRDDQFQYDLSTNIQLGKFFPDDWKVRIPMYYAISESTILPEYDPVDTDIKLSEKLDRYSGMQRDSIKKNAETYIGRKSINFTNVGVESVGDAGFFAISNFSISYSYNETRKRDLKTAFDLEKNYRGALSYVYNKRPKPVTPFKNISFLKSPYFRFIKDFNFYFMPSQLSVRTDMSRTYHEVQGRNIDNPLLKIDPSYDKNFSWNRYYDVKFDLSKSLSFDFSASTIAKIDETDGMVDKDRDTDLYERWRDTVINNIFSGGRVLNYNHSFSFSYRLPINKLPFLTWVTANARYSGAYDWQAGPVMDDDTDLGNIIKNKGTKQINSRLNLLSLYNSSKWLKNVNNKYSGRKRRKKSKRVRYSTKLRKVEGGKLYSIIHNLKTSNVKVSILNSKRSKLEFQIISRSKNSINLILPNDVSVASINVSGVLIEEESIVNKAAGFLARMLMSIRSVSLSYTENNNSTLPGFMPSSGVFASSPGFDFITGNTGNSYGMYAADKGWLSRYESMNSPFLMSKNNIFSIKATVEPINGLKINFVGKRSLSEDNSMNIVYENSIPKSNNIVQTGRFSMTYLSLNSSFFSVSNDVKSSKGVYDEFLSNRVVESKRLAKKRWGNSYNSHINSNNPNFYEGYGTSSQDVLIPAFLSAYGAGKSKDLFPSLLSMLPNWNIRYSGLKKIDFIAEYFQTININHSYSCTYNVDSYMNNSNFGGNVVNSVSGNFFPKYDVSSVSIEERFSPLINIDMVWKNSFTTRFELNRKRSVNLSLTNSQLSENSSNEYIIGIGYRFKHLPIIIKQTEIDNNLNLRCDFSIRKNNSIIRKIENNVSQLTSGQEVMTLKVSADYTLNNRFNLRLFYDRVVNDPYVSLSFRTINSNFGLSVRFTLIE